MAAKKNRNLLINNKNTMGDQLMNHRSVNLNGSGIQSNVQQSFRDNTQTLRDGIEDVGKRTSSYDNPFIRDSFNQSQHDPMRKGFDLQGFKESQELLPFIYRDIV